MFQNLPIENLAQEKITDDAPLNLAKFFKNSDAGPPYWLQLSMASATALFPWIAEHSVEPVHVPTSRYRIRHHGQHTVNKHSVFSARHTPHF
jgi:hypothetical protein